MNDKERILTLIDDIIKEAQEEPCCVTILEHVINVKEDYCKEEVKENE